MDTIVYEYGLGAVHQATCKFSKQLDDNPYLLASIMDGIWDTGCAVAQPIQIAVSAYGSSLHATKAAPCLLQMYQANCDPTGFFERVMLNIFSWMM